MSPTRKPLSSVAHTPSQQVDVKKEPPSNVTPHVATVVQMMHASHRNHMTTYMRMSQKKMRTLIAPLHARILHSLFFFCKKTGQYSFKSGNFACCSCSTFWCRQNKFPDWNPKRWHAGCPCHRGWHLSPAARCCLQPCLSATTLAAGGSNIFTTMPECSSSWCILCGRYLNPSSDRRYKSHQSTAALLEQRCYPTPFVYRHIIATSSSSRDNRCACCIACVNWIRRLTRRRKATKIPLPVDNILLFLHSPGAAIVRPDQRSFQRLLKSLAGGKNPYTCFCTPVMERILGRLSKEQALCNHVPAVVYVWWKTMGSNTFLEDRVTAQHVRRALRYHEGTHQVQDVSSV